MIIITTQIETQPNGNMSIAAVVRSENANHKEDMVAKLLQLAMQTAGELLMKETKSGLMIQGGDVAIELIKSKMKEVGLQFEGSPVDHASRGKAPGL